MQQYFFQTAYLSSLQGNNNGQLCAPLALVKDKMLSASGGLRSLTPDQGLCPWTPLEAPSPDPQSRYKLALSARHETLASMTKFTPIQGSK